jgi:hypothetical protein
MQKVEGKPYKLFENPGELSCLFGPLGFAEVGVVDLKDKVAWFCT